MARNIYITAMGPYSGKSIVALGFTEMLSARLRRIGFFRPIIRGAGEPDPQIELMRHRYQLQSSYSEMHGPTADAVTALIAHGAHEEIEKRVLTAYRELERRCDFVVCEGTDFVGATPALDFDLNAEPRQPTRLSGAGGGQRGGEHRRSSRRCSSRANCCSARTASSSA